MQYRIEILDDYVYDSPENFDGEVDVKVIFKSGAEYMVTFITLSTLSNRLKVKDDRRSQNFLTCSNEDVICKELSRQSISTMLEDIIRDEFYWTIFLPCNEEAENEVAEKTKPSSKEEVEKWIEEMEKMIDQHPPSS